jgi:hypothetical protein
MSEETECDCVRGDDGGGGGVLRGGSSLPRHGMGCYCSLSLFLRSQ